MIMSVRWNEFQKDMAILCKTKDKKNHLLETGSIEAFEVAKNAWKMKLISNHKIGLPCHISLF